MPRTWVTRIVNLNVMALLLLAHAIVPRFTEPGVGSIINISSVRALAREDGSTVYGGTKAFVLFLSQSLQFELAPKGVYVQAVLPVAIRTAIWERSGKDVTKLPAVFDVARTAMIPNFDQAHAAARYRPVAA